MSGIFILVFLCYPARKGERRDRLYWYDFLFILAGLSGTGYVIVNALEIVSEGRLMATPAETVLGVMTLTAVLEAVRRTVGWPMIIIALVFILYAKFSYLAPGILSAHFQAWPQIMAEVYLSPSGVLGTLTTLSSTIIITFITFGAFFMKAGGGQVFLDLALSLTGTITGGPAKAAIVASALFGTLSGSTAANVAVTGNITIPLMKRTGYSPVFAGAVEAVASTGGQLMPPIMGTIPFIMASLLGVSYATIAMAAIIPAMLYYFALFVQTHLRAAKDGLRGIALEDRPSFLATLRGGWEFGLPLLFLILALFVLRYPPAIAASYTIGVLLLVSSIRKRTRLNWRDFVDALVEGVRGTLFVAPIISAAGIILSTLSMTGVGPKLASSLVDIAGGNLAILVIVAALASYITGMGVSMIITYLLLSVLIAPALEMAGVPLLVAHLCMCYIGLTMFITPPYAMTAFVAAAISGASPYRTGFQAMRLGIVTFLVPFILIYNPALILIGTPAEIALAAVTAMIGVFALSVGIEGYLFSKCNWVQRILAIGTGIAMMTPGLASDITGVGLLGLVILWQWRSKEKQPLTMPEKTLNALGSGQK